MTRDPNVYHKTEILRPSNRKFVAQLAVCIFFVLCGLWMRKDSPALGWCAVVFFGLATIVLGSKLLPQASYLEVGPDGFIICELFRRSPLFAWQNVSEFKTTRLSTAPQLFVVFDEWSPSRPGLAKKNKALFGFTSALPDTYGRSASALAEDLNIRRSLQIAEPDNAPS